MDIVFSRIEKVNISLYSYREYVLEVTIPSALRMARHVLLSECSVLNSNAWRIEFCYAGNGAQGGDEIVTVVTPDETIARMAEQDLMLWLASRTGHEPGDMELPEHEGWYGKSTLTI